MNKTKSNIRIPKQQRGINTKTSIINTALRLYSDKGYHKTNSKEIAKEAGIAIGSFYAYYKNKKVLFIDVLNIHLQEMLNNISDFLEKIALNNLKDKELINNLIANTLEAYDLNNRFQQEINAIIKTEPDIKKLVEEHEANIKKNILNLLELNKKYLKIKNIETAAEMLNFILQSFSQYINFKQIDINKDILIGELSEIILKYLYK